MKRFLNPSGFSGEGCNRFPALALVAGNDAAIEEVLVASNNIGIIDPKTLPYITMVGKLSGEVYRGR